MTDIDAMATRFAELYMAKLEERGQCILAKADIERLEAEAQALREEVAALRARVVVMPERMEFPPMPMHPCVEDHEACGEVHGWNACLNELARLNGQTVSERLLRDLLKSAQKLSDRASNFMVSGVEFIEIGDNNSAVMELEVTLEALRALLDEGKEDVNAPSH
ncbi:hypothetical protein [Pseudomonas citronellolis]|uniref:hypothetical protein n=1 Tax=Pseudomonas citronellolis TaxID=53408 RepID=UPI000778E334|nr:hypothetical protein [Pseudomonas citronellolis]AMO78077.1 hypothetical protein PcP3B5_46850 [Pseudomonas citronellolis]